MTKLLLISFSYIFLYLVIICFFKISMQIVKDYDFLFAIGKEVSYVCCRDWWSQEFVYYEIKDFLFLVKFIDL